MNILSLFDGIGCGHQALKDLGLGDKIENYFASEIDSKAIATSVHNHNCIQLGDVRNLSYKDGVLTNGKDSWKVKIDLILAGSPCFVAGTPVLTTHGFMPIEDLQYGESVFTHTQKIKSVLKVGGKLSKVYTLYAKSVLPIKTTFTHPFYIRHITRRFNNTLNKIEVEFSDFHWRNAGSLKRGDYLTIPRKLTCELPKEVSNFKDEDFFRIGYSLLSEDTEPPWYLPFLSSEKLKLVFDGLFSIENNKQNHKYSLSTSSRKLIETLVLCVAKVYGVACVVNKQSNEKEIYHLDWNVLPDDETRASFVDEDYLYIPFCGLEYSGKDFVYNLEVEDDNSYLVQGVCVHNCQGFSFAGKRLAFDDPRSKLYFEFERLLKEINPKYFFLENVRMHKEHHEVITERLETIPIVLNSSLFSPQNRLRYYWTNIPQEPYVINDVGLDSVVGAYDGIWVIPRGTNRGGLKPYGGKCPTITTSSWQYNFFYVIDGIRQTFTPEQCERIAGLPVGYTQGSLNNRIRQIGNGWSVQTVKELLKGLKTVF